MHLAMMLSLQDELEKIANNAAELTGLGILAAPAAHHLMGGKEWSEKSKAKAEVAGLGVLAAPAAYAAGKAGVKKVKAISRAARIAKLRNVAVGVAKHASEKTESGMSKTQLALGSAGLGAVGGLGAHRIALQEGVKHPKTFGLAAGLLTAPLLYAAARAGQKSHQARKEKHAAPTMGAMMNMHRLADAAKAAVKPAAGAVAGAGKALTNPNNMARASHLAGHVAQGGHAWNPAAAAKRAISL